MELTKEEFISKSDEAMESFLKASKQGSERFLAYNLWQILELEEKIKAAMPDCETVRMNHGFTLFGRIKYNGKEIGTYGINPWPEVCLYTFCPKKGKYADELIKQGAVKPIEGVHRILGWHSIVRGGYVHQLAKKQWIIGYEPISPTEEQLVELEKKVFKKTEA